MIADLLALHAIDDRSHRAAAEIWSIAEPSVPAIAVQFYARLRKLDRVAHLDDERAALLEETMSEHWKLLFTGRFGDSYVKCASLVGITHREIGLEASVYIAAYGLLKHDFADTIVRRNLPLDQMTSLQHALDQYLFIDMAMILSTYSAWLVD